MPKNVFIRFRTSRQEYERIRSNALARGYPSISAFLRTLGLEHDLWLEKKIQETNLLMRETHQIVKSLK